MARLLALLRAGWPVQSSCNFLQLTSPDFSDGVSSTLSRRFVPILVVSRLRASSVSGQPAWGTARLPLRAWTNYLLVSRQDRLGKVPHRPDIPTNHKTVSKPGLTAREAGRREVKSAGSG